MSNAWETTDEDIINVLHTMNIKNPEIFVEHVITKLDLFKVEKAALKGNDIDEQTNYAYEEIKEQIIDKELFN